MDEVGEKHTRVASGEEEEADNNDLSQYEADDHGVADATK